MSGKYVFSTLTAPNRYTIYFPQLEDSNNKEAVPRQIKHEVLIEGGAGVANKNFITPLGVMTHITDEQYKALQQNKSFMKHFENGFITVEDKPYEMEKVTGDMSHRDGSAPLREEDFEAELTSDGDPKKAPTTGKVKK